MKRCRILAIIGFSSLTLLTACGGGSSNSTSSTSGSGSSGSSGGTTSNSVLLVVDSGPSGLPANQGEEDLAYITLTVCVPNTTTCQTLDHVQVDTGSEGLRIPSSALTLSLPQQTSGSNTVSECVTFGDNTFVWGPVAGADIQIAGEVAKNVPIQIINSSTPPASCGSGDTQISDVTGLGANAILGVGLFEQDCGGGCVSTLNNPGLYYSCAATNCSIITEPLAAQLQNPVWMFPIDNNGVILQLPSIPSAGQTTAQGALIFGIGTQSNNSVGNAILLQPDQSTGFFAASFNGTTYNDWNGPASGHGSSFIDSGSNGYFFLDSQTLVNQGFPIPDCSGNSNLPGFYCPASTQAINVSVIGENPSTGTPVGTGRSIQFTVANAQTLFNSNNTAFNDVAGPNSNSFDFGLPFFFGKSVYFGIENQKTPLGTGPLYAF
jgi:hypothetical protein